MSVGLALLIAVQAAGGGDCRVTGGTAANGQALRITDCRQSDGSWKRMGMERVGPVPLPERAEVQYKGTFAVRVTQPGPPMRRLDLRSALRAGGTSQELEGAITLVLTFDGNEVRGRATGTGGLIASALSGLVRDGQCRLLTADGTTLYEGACDGEGFNGSVASTETSRVKVSGRFETKTGAVTDIAQRDRERAAAAREAAERAREAAADASRRVAKLEREAAAGDAKAQWLVAASYESGRAPFSQDYAKALSWYLRAAARNYGPAFSGLADMHRSGLGVSQSTPRAFDFDLKCAQAPDVTGMEIYRTECMRIVALSYYEGHGVVRSEAEAVRWYRQCAARRSEKCIDWMNEHGVR